MTSHTKALGPIMGAWVAAALVLVAAPPGRSEAAQRDADDILVGEVRSTWAGEQVPPLVIGAGLVMGMRAAGASCEEVFSVRELEAYLQYTAAPTDTLVQAVQRYFANRKCQMYASGKAVTYWYKAGWDAMADHLLSVRENADRAKLESLVREAAEPGATAEQKAVGVVAGARLLELSKPGGQLPVIRPPDPRAK